MGPEDLWLIKYTPLMWRKPLAISMPQKSWMYHRSGGRGTNTPQGMLWGPKMSSDMATVQSHGMIVCPSACFILHIPTKLARWLAGCIRLWVLYERKMGVCVCMYVWVYVYAKLSMNALGVYYVQTAQFPQLFIRCFLLWFWLFDSLNPISTFRRQLSINFAPEFWKDTFSLKSYSAFSWPLPCPTISPVPFPIHRCPHTADGDGDAASGTDSAGYYFSNNPGQFTSLNLFSLSYHDLLSLFFLPYSTVSCPTSTCHLLSFDSLLWSLLFLQLFYVWQVLLIGSHPVMTTLFPPL